MKKRLLKVTALLLMTAGLSNCARQEALVMPQFPQQVRAASDLQANYMVLEKTEMRKDHNGMQFGFDYYTVEYIYGSKSVISLSHSKRSGKFLLDITENAGTAQEARKISNDKAGIDNVIHKIGMLKLTGTAKDQEVIEEMTKVLKSVNPGQLSSQGGHEVTLSKSQVLAQLSKNTISFSRDEIPGELIIEFSNGRITKPYPGRYRMHLDESGVSTIYVSVTFGPYKPLALSKAETAGLLKSSLNYTQLAAKINEFLK